MKKRIVYDSFFGGDKIKKYILVIILFFLPMGVKADKVTDYALKKIVVGTRNKVVYEITDINLTNNSLIIKGWSFANHIQNHNSVNSHKYMLELIDNGNTFRKVYFSNPKKIDKSNLVKMSNVTRKCHDNEFNTDGSYCYRDLSWSGFEFKIDLGELNSDTQYKINFAINLNMVNETHYFNNGIVIPGFEDTELVNNGIRYSLSGRFDTWEFVVITNYVRNRVEPGKNADSNFSDKPYCRPNDKNLYWHEYETYTNYKGSRWLGSGNEKELWINLKFKYSNYVCQLMTDGDWIQTTMNGTTGSGWISTAFLNYYGEPTTLKLDSLENTKINSIKTYTAPKNSNATIELNINNKINQEIILEVKFKNVLLYTEKVKFKGSKNVIINNLKISSNDKIKVEVLEPSGKKHTIESSIYISSLENITLNDINNNLKIETPIMVKKEFNKSEIKHYESFEIKIPHKKINVIAGQGFNAYIDLKYKSDASNIKLNSFNTHILFNKQDSSLNYPEVNGKIKVNLLKDVLNENHNFFKLPKTYVEKHKGELSTNNKDSNYIDGGNKWYVGISDEIGTYNYEYKIENIGVNLINISIPAQYSIINNLLGHEAFIKIKRVWVPDQLNYFYNKTYLFTDLLKKAAEINEV